MSVSISNAIFNKFPQTRVAFAVVEGTVGSAKKGPVAKFLSDYKQEVVRRTKEAGVTLENVGELPVCKSWERVFSTYGVDSSYRSTIHNLLDRTAREALKLDKGQKADMGKISDIVDLYNCVSIETQTPMGALSESALQGDVVLRFGKEGETFTPLGRTEETFAVKPSHVVYADDQSVLTWLWNYRDAAHACVPKSSGASFRVIVFADQADAEGGDVTKAIDLLCEKVGQIGWKVLQKETLNADRPSAKLVEKAMA